MIEKSSDRQNLLKLFNRAIRFAKLRIGTQQPLVLRVRVRSKAASRTRLHKRLMA